MRGSRGQSVFQLGVSGCDHACAGAVVARERRQSGAQVWNSAVVILQGGHKTRDALPMLLGGAGAAAGGRVHGDSSVSRRRGRGRAGRRRGVGVGVVEQQRETVGPAGGAWRSEFGVG
jgi:hypothetical protein